MVIFGEIDLIGIFDFTGHLACLPRFLLGVRCQISGVRHLLYAHSQEA